MGRLRGFLWLFAGLIVALLAGIVAFVTLARATAKAAAQAPLQAPVEVVAAARAIPARAALTAEDLELKELPAESVPEGALRTLEEALGKVTTVDLYAGEVILAPRLVDPTLAPHEGRLALVVAEEQVLMAFPAQDLMSRAGVLKAGDHVDLLFSSHFNPPDEEGRGKGGASQVTFNALQNVTIAAIVQAPKAAGGSAGQEAILLAVSPQDALVLKYLRDAGGVVDIVLRAPGVERTFPVEPVDESYLVNRYRIRLVDND